MNQPIEVYYFGCDIEAGHYWFAPDGYARMRHISRECAVREAFPDIDSTFCPTTTAQHQGSAQIHHVRGWTVLAWWDRSVDKRGNSNSAIVARGELGFTEMYNLLSVHFPRVLARQPGSISPIAAESIR